MIYILDNELKNIGLLSNDSPGATPFYDDLLTRKIAEDTSKTWLETFTFSVPADYPEAELLDFGRKILVQCEDGKFRMFTIDEVSDTINGVNHLKRVEVAYNSFQMDMFNYNFIAEERVFNPATTGNIIKYLLQNSGWTYNNERELYFGAAKTFTVAQGRAMASLSTFIQEFDLQIDAYIEVENGQIADKIVEFSKTQSDDKEITARFEYRRDLAGAKRTKSNNDFATMLYVYTMPNKNGVRKGIESVNEIENPHTGIVENLPYIYDSEANDLWNNGGPYAVAAIYSEVVGTPQAALEWGKKQLEYYNHPKFTYEIDLALIDETPGLGEKVLIVDLEMSPPLTITATVIGTETSFSNKEVNKITLGEYKELELKEISSIRALQDKISELEKSKSLYTMDDYVGELGEETILKVVARKDGIKIDLPNNSYEWKRTYIASEEVDEGWEFFGPVLTIPTADYQQYYYECNAIIEEYNLILRKDFKIAMTTHLQKVKKFSDEDSIVIGFITDTHYDPDSWRGDIRVQASRSLDYLNNLVEASNHISYDVLVHGGDIIDGRRTKASEAKIQLDEAVGTYRNAKAPRIFCRGNHDTNALHYFHNTSKKFSPEGPILNAEANRIFKQFYKEDGVVSGSGNYGAFEIPNKKLSVIFLDGYELSEKLDVKGERIYTTGFYEAYQPDQIIWLVNYLANLPLGQDIIVFTHAPLEQPPIDPEKITVINKDLILKALNGWRTGGTFSFVSNVTDHKVNFSKTFKTNNPGNLIATIGGHVHSDRASRSSVFGGTAPSFSRTCGYKSTHTTRPMDTIKETAFDSIVINKKKHSIRLLRYGHGRSRLVDYLAQTDITTENDIEVEVETHE